MTATTLKGLPVEVVLLPVLHMTEVHAASGWLDWSKLRMSVSKALERELVTDLAARIVEVVEVVISASVLVVAGGAGHFAARRLSSRTNESQKLGRSCRRATLAHTRGGLLHPRARNTVDEQGAVRSFPLEVAAQALPTFLKTGATAEGGGK